MFYLFVKKVVGSQARVGVGVTGGKLTGFNWGEIKEEADRNPIY